MKGYLQPPGDEGTPARPQLCVEDISQNPSHMLQFIRQVAEVGGELKRWELSLLQDHSAEVCGCPAGKITWEFNRLLLSPAVFDGLQLMVTTGLLGVLIPELLQGQGMEQSYVHPDDVLTHNLRTCSLIKPKLHLRLAGLLHDVGKPGYYVEDPRVGRRFPNHNRRSAALIPVILHRLAYSVQLIDRVKLLVENHMFIWVPQHGLDPIIDLVGQVGRENIEDLIELVTSDRAAIWGERIKESNRALREALAQVKTDSSNS